MVKSGLPVDNQAIVASQYPLYLPTQQQLAEVQKELYKLDKGLAAE